MQGVNKLWLDHFIDAWLILLVCAETVIQMDGNVICNKMHKS